MGQSRQPVRVVLVEDDPAVREGLQLLVGASPSCRCVAAFSCAEDALAGLSQAAADVVLMDINLPGISGIECIKRLKSTIPRIQIMMLTVFEDHDRIFESLAAGANGYLLKQTPPGKLLEAIIELHAGGSPMSTQIARKVVQVFQKAPQPPGPIAVLTSREKEIVALLGKGFLYKEIADQLGLSVETIRTHIHNIYEKLHVRSRTEAVMKLYGSQLHLPG